MNWLRKGLALILIASAAAALSGCWNRKELNEISIASAFGFDKDGGNFKVSVQLINASEIAAGKGSSSGRVPVVTVQESSGHTLFESIRAMTETTPRKIYGSHLRLLVIGEDLAREGIARLLDLLSRDHELRTDFYIVIAKGISAKDVLQILTPLEKIPSDKLYSSLVSSQRNWGVTATVDLHQLIYDLVDKGKDPVLAGLRVLGNPELGQTEMNFQSASPPAKLRYQSLAVFRKDKLVGWLNEEQSKGYNYVSGELQSTIVRLPCPEGGQLAIEIINTHHRIKGKVEDGRPRIDVRLDAEGNIGEMECAMNLQTPQSIRWLESKLDEQLENSMKSVIAQAKAYRADIFGFGSAIHRADFRAWRRLEDHWEEAFAELPVHIAVRAKIRRTGSVVESFLERMGDS
ncbi:Ger(x)C family spore germination protein [Cohnella sp. 56]|uniref:Ger(x)C family spore germination protein n=1 Tax=Cohnella sp. 56 TaxID=3113722 RepID=UPI0030EAD654